MGIMRITAILLLTATAVKLEHRPMDNQALLYDVTAYSVEIANGDSSDNKDLHEEEDMNDDVVDYNGQTNRGYGSMRPVDFFAGNHIASGHFVTEPREFSPLFDQRIDYLGCSNSHDTTLPRTDTE